MNGLASYGIEPTCAYVDMSTIPQEGRSDPPVKPTSEVAHQPGQQTAAADAFCPICPEAQWGYWATGFSAWERCFRLKRCGLRLCGGVQRGEIKSAGQTTGGARGGSRLGNPCDEGGLTR